MARPGRTGNCRNDRACILACEGNGRSIHFEPEVIIVTVRRRKREADCYCSAPVQGVLKSILAREAHVIGGVPQQSFLSLVEFKAYTNVVLSDWQGILFRICARSRVDHPVPMRTRHVRSNGTLNGKRSPRSFLIEWSSPQLADLGFELGILMISAISDRFPQG